MTRIKEAKLAGVLLEVYRNALYVFFDIMPLARVSELTGPAWTRVKLRAINYYTEETSLDASKALPSWSDHLEANAIAHRMGRTLPSFGTLAEATFRSGRPTFRRTLSRLSCMAGRSSVHQCWAIFGSCSVM